VDNETETKMELNPLVHVVDDAGDPVRKEDGAIKLKTNWQTTAEDRKGRPFNAKIHGEKISLDGDGFIKVIRRDTKYSGKQLGRTEAFVAQYHEKGYAYYLANNESGRCQQMEMNDWEPVMTDKGPAEMPVGQARGGNTQGRLFRKPQEWYDAFQ